jgi:hypothetical protein
VNLVHLFCFEDFEFYDFFRLSPRLIDKFNFETVHLFFSDPISPFPLPRVRI